MHVMKIVYSYCNTVYMHNEAQMINLYKTNGVINNIDYIIYIENKPKGGATTAVTAQAVVHAVQQYSELAVLSA